MAIAMSYPCPNCYTLMDPEGQCPECDHKGDGSCTCAHCLMTDCDNDEDDE